MILKRGGRSKKEAKECVYTCARERGREREREVERERERDTHTHTHALSLSLSLTGRHTSVAGTSEEMFVKPAMSEKRTVTCLYCSAGGISPRARELATTYSMDTDTHTHTHSQ